MEETVDYIVTVWNDQQYASYPWDTEYPFRWRLNSSTPWHKRNLNAMLSGAGEVLAAGDLHGAENLIKMIRATREISTRQV